MAVASHRVDRDPVALGISSGDSGNPARGVTTFAVQNVLREQRVDGESVIFTYAANAAHRVRHASAPQLYDMISIRWLDFGGLIVFAVLLAVVTWGVVRAVRRSVQSLRDRNGPPGHRPGAFEPPDLH